MHRINCRLARKRARLGSVPFEPLETRALMTTIVVNTIVDALYPAATGLVSIADAVQTADSSTTPTTITFDPTVFATAQTIVQDGTELTLSNTKEPISILGPASGVTLDCDGGSRGFEISSGVTAEIADLTIKDGQTSGYDFYGGAVNNAGNITLVGDTFTDNSAGNGGAIDNSGTATLINVTAVGNNADYNGLGGSGNGSAIFNTGPMTIDDSTIDGNVSNNGAAFENGSSVIIANTIIADNTLSSGGFGDDAAGTFTSYGYNLVSRDDGSSGWNGTDLTGTAAAPKDPDLGPLADNGGPTRTMLPQSGSPAIDAGSTEFIPAGYITDQRGLSRTVSGNVDIGAVEVGGTAVADTGDYVVDTTSDTATGTGTVTLREAIELADADVNPVVNTITFDPSVFTGGQAITLDGTELTVDGICEPVVIDGPAGGLTLSGNGASRVIEVGFGSQASLSGLTVTGGDATDLGGDGGAIYADSGSVLTLDNVTLSSNTGVTNGSGGGLANLGNATLTDVTISGNTVTGAGSSGGGVYNAGTLAWNGGSLATNTAGAGGGGAATTGSLTLTDVTVSGNTASADGGGIDATGGNISASACTFSSNSTDQGNGGAISINNADGTFTDDTLNANTCTINGGGIEIYSPGNATLTDDTIAGNTAGANGGGVRVAGSATIGNTIIAGNSATSSGPDVSGDPDSEGNNLIGADDDSYGWLSTDLTGTAASPLDADLGALADNGGPTETMPPESGSPAIGAGSVSLIPSGVTTDQRGLPRTVDGAVDIGAVQVQTGGGQTGGQTGAAATSITLTASSSSVSAGQPVTFTAAVSSTTGQPTGTVNFLENGSSIGTAPLNGSGDATLTVSDLPSGSNSITASYIGDSAYDASTSTAVTVDITPAGTLAATVATLTSSANIFPVGDHCFLTCTVAPKSGTGPAPTGTVSILQNGVAQVTETLGAGGTVTFQWNAITAGPSAADSFVYSGDANYAASTSNTIDQSYPALSQLSANITRAVIPSTNIAGQPLNARIPASFTNSGSALAGTYTIDLYADTSTGGLTGNQILLDRVTRREDLRDGKTLAATLAAKTLPKNTATGTYYLLAEVTDPTGAVNIVNTSQT